MLTLMVLGYLASGLSEPRRESPTVVRNDDIATTVSLIDQHRSDQLSAAGLPSAAMADWMTVCRRLSLALVGNQVSLEELRELETYPLEERESVHLANLLHDARFPSLLGRTLDALLGGDRRGSVCRLPTSPVPYLAGRMVRRKSTLRSDGPRAHHGRRSLDRSTGSQFLQRDGR